MRMRQPLSAPSVFKYCVCLRGDAGACTLTEHACGHVQYVQHACEFAFVRALTRDKVGEGTIWQPPGNEKVNQSNSVSKSKQGEEKKSERILCVVESLSYLIDCTRWAPDVRKFGHPAVGLYPAVCPAVRPPGRPSVCLAAGPADSERSIFRFRL